MSSINRKLEWTTRSEESTTREGYSGMGNSNELRKVTDDRLLGIMNSEPLEVLDANREKITEKKD